MQRHLSSILLGSACSLILLSLLAPLRADTDMPFINPGFEDGLTGWALWQDNGMSKVVPEAAHTGNAGLRVTDTSTTSGCSIENRRFPAVPAKSYDLKFWLRSVSGEGGSVHLRFYGANGDVVADQVVASGATAWTQLDLKATAPADAVQVGIWIHTGNAAICTVDFDDFTMTQID